MAESAKDKKPLPCELQLKSPADKVSDIFRNKCYLFSTIMPQDVKNVVQISAGVWLWTFVDEVRCGNWKYNVETSADTEPIKWTLLEGKVPNKLYRNLSVDYNFSSNEGGCLASAELNFVKNNANVPDPTDYSKFILKMFEKVDEYIQNQNH